MGQENRYVRFHEKGAGRALIELAKQYHPRDAIREFVTNALDGGIEDHREEIALVIDPSGRRLLISDNGEGMSHEKLFSLEESIGYSLKKDKMDARGEKGLGLLAFASLGNVMHVLSKSYQDSGSKYGYIRWAIDERKGEILAHSEVLDASEVRSHFYGAFPRGTRVIVDGIDTHIMNELLTIGNLKKYLRSLYNPALRNRLATIRLGRKSGKKVREAVLKPIEYDTPTSSVLIDEKMEINLKGEEIPGELEVLLYLDPTASSSKVAVYSKDVLVYDSLAELTEFSRSPVWASGKVSGFVNDRFNRLILGRAGIDRKRNAFKAWYGAIQNLEVRIGPKIEESKIRGEKVIEEGHIKAAFDALIYAWKDLEKTDFGQQYARSGEGDLLTVVGVEPTTERGKGPRGPRKPKPSTPAGRPPGPGTFIYDPEGHVERVSPKKGVPFGYPQPKEFSVEESHLRIKLEDLLGSPTLLINSTHEDYLERVSASSKDAVPFRRYVIELSAKEAINYQVRKAEREHRLFGDKDEIVGAALQRVEDLKFEALKHIGIK